MEHKSDGADVSVQDGIEPQGGEQEKSFFGIIVHSFFIVPFLIAVFSVLLFVAVRLLTMEARTAHDYLNDVKVGGLTKRWQSAFELSKILSNPKSAPQDARFTAELIRAFEESSHDDSRIRQYLALAMGQMGKKDFVKPLLSALRDEKEENLYAVIYALGLLRDAQSVEQILTYLDHPSARIRLVSVMTLGNLGDRLAVLPLRKMLNDSQPNVVWDAAIALAKLKDEAGCDILERILDREYLRKFPEVDAMEQTQIILVAIEASQNLDNEKLNKAIARLCASDANMEVRKAALAAKK